ncbi:hypothetical protein B0H17DRAFT_1184831 [Mycena rosella]|uniref:Uncharacterized protein n=1 Tax=Mycena rosella TaxID=1033263 RepID=A0AAD7CU47_MYCRO|nr:hypothetical protein B0H17DRAFT_1184831 [Mycena rosella]
MHMRAIKLNTEHIVAAQEYRRDHSDLRINTHEEFTQPEWTSPRFDFAVHLSSAHHLVAHLDEESALRRGATSTLVRFPARFTVLPGPPPCHSSLCCQLMGVASWHYLVLVKTAVAVVVVLAALTPTSKATHPRPSFKGPSIVTAVQQPLSVPTVTSCTQDGSTLLVEQAHLYRTPVKNGMQHRFEPNGETCLPKCQAGLVLNKDGKCIPETSEVFKDFCTSGSYLNAVEGVGYTGGPANVFRTTYGVVCQGGYRGRREFLLLERGRDHRGMSSLSDPGKIPHTPIAAGGYQIQNVDNKLWLTNDVEGQKSPVIGIQVWNWEPQPGGSYRVSSTVEGVTQYLYAPNGAPPKVGSSPTNVYIERRANGHYFIRPVDACPVLVVESRKKLVTRGIDPTYDQQPCWNLTPVKFDAGATAATDSGLNVNGDSSAVSMIGPPALACSEPVKDGMKVCTPRLAISKKCTICCSPGFILTNGECVRGPEPVRFPVGFTLVNGECVRGPDPVQCPAGFILIDGNCVPGSEPSPCPAGFTLINGECVRGPDPVQCPAGFILRDGNCVPGFEPPFPCAAGFTLIDGECVPGSEPPSPCPARFILRDDNCVPGSEPPSPCAVGFILINGVCVPGSEPPSPCPAGSTLINGECVRGPDPIRCSAGFIPINGECIIDPSHHSASTDPNSKMMCSDTTDSTGSREVKCAVKCPPGFVLKNGLCIIPTDGPSVTIAGTRIPRDDDLMPCGGKIFRLPGKGGCVCAATTPPGAEKCPGVGPKEYAICKYDKDSGNEAMCTTECIKGRVRPLVTVFFCKCSYLIAVYTRRSIKAWPMAEIRFSIPGIAEASLTGCNDKFEPLGVLSAPKMN